MTKFEQIGVNLQNNSASRAEAKKKFAYSCMTCCLRGLRIQCDCCAISTAHQMTIGYFDSYGSIGVTKT